jgi:hypothetical protein
MVTLDDMLAAALGDDAPDQPDRAVGLADTVRYITGLPLIRKHRRLDEGWSFLCPVPTCQRWRAQYGTAGQCRTGWYRHCAEPDHDPHFSPSWPADVPYEPVTQPIAWPGDGTDVDALHELARQGLAVDLAGRPLTTGRCASCPAGDCGQRHQVLSGRTCVRQVPCPKCNATAGQECDRSTPALTVVRYAKHGGASGHEERFAAAVQDEDRRRAAGDLTLPAGWAPELAPTARRNRPARPKMSATLRVAAPSDTNDMWKSLVYDYVRAGLLFWTDRCTVAHILCRDVQTATWSANFITEFYGITADRVTVLGQVDERFDDKLFRRLVYADAMHVLRTASGETPQQHLAWAAGVFYADHARDLLPENLTAAKLAVAAGYCSAGLGLYPEKSTLTVSVGSGAAKLVLRWTEIAAAISSGIDPMLRAEMRTAVAEAETFPRYVREWRRAQDWCEDLAMQAWMAVRPVDLPAYDAETNPDQTRVRP